MNSESENTVSGFGKTRALFPTALLLTLFAATVLRVVYWTSVSGEAWFQFPGMDPEYYNNWAKDILAGHGGRYIPFPRGPLYPYLLAFVKAVCGEGWLWPRLLNLCADLTVVSVVYHLTRRFATPLSALLASLIPALCGISIYFSGELLGTSFETAFAALLLLSLFNALETPRWRLPALTGGILGLFTLVRPTALILLPLYPLLSFIKSKNSHPPSLQTSAIHIAFVILTIAPVTVTNYVASGEFIPVSTLGGVNFYIGNARGSTGWSSYLPGVGADWTDSEAIHLAQNYAGRKLRPGEASNTLFIMGLREISSDPANWLGLTFRKILLLVGARETGNNRPFTLVWEAAPWLKIFQFISIGFILPLALWGYIALRKHSILAARTPALYILIFSIGLLAFFIASRYRMPLLPALSILAGIGLKDAITRLHHKSGLTPLAVTLSIGWLLTLPSWKSANEHPAQADYVAGNALLRQNRNLEAINRFELASAIDPDFLRLKLNLGVAWLQSGDTVRAKEFFLSAKESPRMLAEALNNLGIIAEGNGNLSLAVEEYSQALDANPQLEDARWNLARALMSLGDSLLLSGDIDSGEIRYSSAVKLIPDDPRPYYRLAVAAMGRGNTASAYSIASSILEKHPNFTPARQMLLVLQQR